MIQFLHLMLNTPPTSAFLPDANVIGMTTSSTTTINIPQAPVNTRIPWCSSASMTASSSLPVDVASSPLPSSTPQQRRSLTKYRTLLQSELIQLTTRLDQCISHPEDTWLQPNLIKLEDGLEVAQSKTMAMLECVVTLMVTCRNNLQRSQSQSPSTTPSSLLSGLIVFTTTLTQAKE
jgi:hypothetical protein